MQITGTFTAQGAAPAPHFMPLGGSFNFSLWGTFVATVVLERSFDDGTTWLPLSADPGGSAAAFAAPCSLVVHEPEAGVLYRPRCSAWTSGTVNWRLSQ